MGMPSGSAKKVNFLFVISSIRTGSALSLADADGKPSFERTFTLGEVEFEEEGQVISYADLKPLQNRAIVLHGMTVNGEYVATLPVACGQIMPNNNGKKMGM